MLKWEKFKKDIVHSIYAEQENRKGYDKQMRKKAKIPKQRQKIYDDTSYGDTKPHAKPKKINPVTSNHFSSMSYMFDK